MSDQRQAIDPALEAAVAAYRRDGFEEPCAAGITGAIRAYEAHKASAVPEEIAEVVQWLRKADASNGGWGQPYLARAADLLERLAGLHPHDQEQRQPEDVSADSGNQDQGHGVKSK